MKLLLISDTHVPRRARDLPRRVWDEVDRAETVLHAGDWVDVGLLDALHGRAARLIGCWGNNDGPDLRARLPEEANATLAGLLVGHVLTFRLRHGRDRTDAAGVAITVVGSCRVPHTSSSAEAARPGSRGRIANDYPGRLPGDVGRVGRLIHAQLAICCAG